MTLAAVLLGFLALPMLMSGTTVALPRIGAELHATGAALQWVVIGYFLAAGSMMLVAGTLGDIVGRRRVFAAGAAVYTAGVLVSAVAADITVLDAARTLSGIGAAGVMASGAAILGATFAGQARTRVFAAMGSTAGVGLAIGPTLSGWLVDALGWRATFGVFAAIGAVILLGATAVEESRAEPRPRMDIVGAVLLTAALTLLMFGTNQASETGWHSPSVLLPMTTGAALLVVFVLVERGGAHPVLDLGLLTNRGFSAWCLAGLFVVAGPSGVMIYLPTYLHGARHLAPGAVGVIMLALTVPVFVMPQASAWLINRGVSARALITVSLTSIAAGNAWLTTLHPGIDPLGLLGPLAAIGSGMGMALGTTDSQAMNHVEASQFGMAAGVLNTVRTTGATMAATVFGTGLIGLLQARVGAHESATRIAAGDVTSPGQAEHYTQAWQTALVAAAVTVNAMLRQHAH